VKMKKPTKWFAATLAALVIATGLPAGALATGNSDFWVSDQTNTPPKLTQRMVWHDSINGGTYFSTDPRNMENSEFNRKQISNDFKTVLGVCETTLEPGCVSSVEFKVADTWQKALIQKSPGQRTYAFGTITPDMKWDIAKSSIYKADPKAGIFAASEPNLFTFPGAANRHGESYWVNAVVTSAMKGSRATITGIDISAWAAGIEADCPSTSTSRIESSQGVYCNNLVNLPKDLEIKVSVYLGDRIKELSGWFDGRMLQPTIDFGISKPGYVTVSGAPIEVSTAITGFIPKGDPLYSVDPSAEIMQGETGTTGLALGRRDGIMLWNKFGSKVLDKAASTNTYWRLSSWLGGNEGQYNCPSVSGVRGVILSNAAAYTPTAPALNSATGSLDFEVASTHFKENGDLNEGFYDLLLNEKLAKCIWGMGVTGNNASISVVNSDGSAQVATTTFAISGGWAKFKAYGYHYSKPKISVNLGKAKSSVATKKTTITCAKGKQMKKVTAIAPKCPTGFKAK
jgi:hypothetical protein